MNTFAQSPPVISSVTPPNGTPGVATDSSIVFTFDKPLGITSSFPVLSTEGFTGNVRIDPLYLSFTYTVSIDRTTITLNATSPLPSNTVITWTLNPSGAFLPLGNDAGSIATVSGSFTTASSGNPAPTIVSVTPDYNAIDVSPSSSITFTFDQEMDTTIDPLLGSPPFFTGNFQITPINDSFLFSNAQWSADGRSLTLINSVWVALGKTITWRLNPTGTTTPLKSAAGEPLVEATGSFTIITSTGGSPNELCNPMGDPTGGYLITKVFAHEQLSAFEVVPSASPKPILNVSALHAFGDPEVTGGSITIPGGGNFPLTTTFGPYAYYGPRDTEAELNADYPTGNYTLRFTLNGGSEHTINMTMPATSTVSVPKITNYDQAQSIDASQDFTFHWDMQNLNAESQILFTISDEIGNLIFLAPNICIPRELSPSATSVLVPAGYLKPGLKYRGLLQFGNFFYRSDDTVPDMDGIGAIYRFTTFDILTTGDGTGNGGETLPATFSGFGFNNEGKPSFSVSGSALRTYIIRRSSTVADPVWSNVGTLILDGTGIDTFVDNDPNLTFPAFYQAVGN